MNTTTKKRHPPIACCGIDCGLCPHYYTAGSSRCPGCGGPDFELKHPSCGILTCCVKKKGLEVCGLCPEFPCSRLRGWHAADSFVTHARSLENLRAIKRDGLPAFLRQQARRIRLLEVMLAEFDDGRSKSLFCTAAALLPLDALDSAVKEARVADQDLDRKERAQLLRKSVEAVAAAGGLVLRLRNKR